MLSKTEREYLSKKYLPSDSHKRVLDHKIRKKIKEFFMLELPLIQGSSVTDFGNLVTEFSNAFYSETQMFVPQAQERCGHRDLNPGNGLGRPAYYQAIL